MTDFEIGNLLKNIAGYALIAACVVGLIWYLGVELWEELYEWARRKLGHERCPFEDAFDGHCWKWVRPAGTMKAGMNLHMMDKHGMSIFDWEDVAKSRMNRLILESIRSGYSGDLIELEEHAEPADKPSPSPMSQRDMRRAARDLVKQRDRLRQFNDQ